MSRGAARSQGMNASTATVHRNVPGRLVAGVCAALAQRLSMEVALVRVLFVVSLAFTGGLAFWVYFAGWLVTPYDVGARAPLRRLVDALTGFFTTPTPPSQGGIETL